MIFFLSSRLRCRTPPRSIVPEPRSSRIYRNPSDTDSDGDDRIDGYDYWEEQMDLAQGEDDDWREL